MTEIEKKALALLNECAGTEVHGGWGTFDPNLTPCTRALCRAIEQREALQADKAKMRETLKQIEASTYPRPLGKSWRMDLSSSKHDRCIHDEWMYDTCEGCLDDFIRKALQETER